MVSMCVLTLRFQFHSAGEILSQHSSSSHAISQCTHQCPGNNKNQVMGKWVLCDMVKPSSRPAYQFAESDQELPCLLMTP
ncbi:hypothetical protein DPMN_170851 [Dreissena polymorpha]|uniref:Uncharacterized protein n=1 Tax=Dreissena polymorpha TaxID=45954 RepID=A0A9D4IEZ5_DREPO|nr:hypothetical protein DPMN_170851 [Dreissena polymorpha]